VNAAVDLLDALLDAATRVPIAVYVAILLLGIVVWFAFLAVTHDEHESSRAAQREPSPQRATSAARPLSSRARRRNPLHLSRAERLHVEHVLRDWRGH